MVRVLKGWIILCVHVEGVYEVDAFSTVGVDGFNYIKMRSMLKQSQNGSLAPHRSQRVLHRQHNDSERLDRHTATNITPLARRPVPELYTKPALAE
jgi:hypothetical protein